MCSLAVLVTGLLTEFSLGDEAFHYRFAENIFKAGKRVAFDPLYGTGRPPGYFYITEPLWHTLLAVLWKLFGKISFPLAQAYHTVYYALLILFTYLLGRDLYDKRQGLLSALIVATIPAIVIFSTVFYLDVPATALSIFCLWLLIKKRFFWAGIILGLMYLTKRNACFFLPAFIFLVFYQKELSLAKKFKSFLCFLAPALFLILPDILWRENHIKDKLTIEFNGKQIVYENFGTLGGVIDRISPKWWKYKTQEYLNSSLFNLTDVVKYFGVILIITLFLYVLFKMHKKRDLILWAPVISYFFFYCFIFCPASDIRYLLPIFPLLAILSSGSIIKYLNKKWLKLFVIFLCLMQFSSVLLFIKEKRQISKGIKAGFAYIRDNVSPDGVILYPEVILINATNHKHGWAGNLPLVMKNLFWDEDETKIVGLLKENNVTYIAIKKSRVYDDSERRHFGGYPKSFINRLPRLKFAKLVFDNSEMSIWKIR